MKQSTWLYCFTFCALFFMGCALDLDPERKKKQREDLIEKLTTMETDSLKKELDSMCIRNRKEDFDNLVDSVLKIRLDKLKKNSLEYYEAK